MGTYSIDLAHGTKDIPLQWVWDQCISIEEPTLLSAGSGVGKSLWALDMTICAVGKQDWHGCKHSGLNIRALYVDGELSPHTYHQRLKAAGVDGMTLTPADDCSEAPCFLYTDYDTLLQQEIIGQDGFEGVQRYVLSMRNKYGINWVVLDSLRVLVALEDENDASSFHTFNQMVLRLRSEGMFVLVIHHTTKDGSKYAGSANVLTTFSNSMLLERNGDIISLTVDKCRSLYLKAALDQTKYEYSNGKFFWLDDETMYEESDEFEDAIPLMFSNGIFRLDDGVNAMLDRYELHGFSYNNGAKTYKRGFDYYISLGWEPKGWLIEKLKLPAKLDLSFPDSRKKFFGAITKYYKDQRVVSVKKDRQR